MRDKYKWREDKKTDFMSRLDDINTELCGLGIKIIQNKEMDLTAINVDPVAKKTGANMIQYKQKGHTER